MLIRIKKMRFYVTNLEAFLSNFEALKQTTILKKIIVFKTTFYKINVSHT